MRPAAAADVALNDAGDHDAMGMHRAEPGMNAAGRAVEGVEDVFEAISLGMTSSFWIPDQQ